MTTAVKNVNAAQLAVTLGIAVDICEVFLTEAQRREPNAEYSIHQGDQPRAAIHFPYGDILELQRRNGFVTIGCAGGAPIGEQYCMLLPLSSVTNYEAALRFAAQFSETELVRFDLLRTLTDRMTPVYARIDAIRNGASPANRVSGLRAEPKAHRVA